jgi:hypothetical protein
MRRHVLVYDFECYFPVLLDGVFYDTAEVLVEFGLFENLDDQWCGIGE